MDFTPISPPLHLILLFSIQYTHITHCNYCPWINLAPGHIAIMMFSNRCCFLMSTALIYRIQGNNSDRYWMVRATTKKPDIHIILLWVSILCSMYVIYKILYIIYRYTHVGPKYLVRNNNVALYRRHHKDARYCIFDMQTCHCSVCVCVCSAKSISKAKSVNDGVWRRDRSSQKIYYVCGVRVNKIRLPGIFGAGPHPKIHFFCFCCCCCSFVSFVPLRLTFGILE